MASRDQLLKQLTRLDADVPAMRQRLRTPAALIGTFATKAESITEAVTEEDAEWVFEQLDAILDKHGYPDRFESQSP